MWTATQPPEKGQVESSAHCNCTDRIMQMQLSPLLENRFPRLGPQAQAVDFSLSGQRTPAYPSGPAVLECCCWVYRAPRSEPALAFASISGAKPSANCQLSPNLYGLVQPSHARFLGFYVRVLPPTRHVLFRLLGVPAVEPRFVDDSCRSYIRTGD